MPDSGQGPPISAEAQRLIQAGAVSIYHELRHFYPLEPDDVLQQIAVNVVGDQLITLRPMFEKLMDASVSKVGVALQRPSKLAGGKTAELVVGAQRRLADCGDLNEVMTHITVVALVTSPLARALLAREGYHLRFIVDGAAPPVGDAKVVDLASRRPKKKR